MTAVKKAPITPTKTWTRISQWLPPRNADMDYWWKLTGLHLAKMLEAAGYSEDVQVDALIFHYHWIVPYLGPAPGPNNHVQWKSLLGVEGSPIEYSWKWNTPTSKPDIRYTMEGISPYSGTALDPLNHQATIEMLHRIAAAVPTVDLTWTNHFLATLFDHDRSKYAREAAAGTHFATTIVVAAEWLPRGLSLKTYLVPRRLGQKDGMLPLAQWEESLALLSPNCAARAAMHEFLQTSPEGRLMNPYMLAVDNVAPEKSRLKFYMQTPHTSFASVREVMTLGGRIPVPESQLQDLRTLLLAVSGLPADFPDEQEVPCQEQYQPSAIDNFVELPILLSGYLYYFDIAPGPAVPGIKVYTPVRRYGPDDRALADGIMGWMEAHGRGEYCQRYSKMLEDLTQHRKLEDGKGMQTYVSCLFKGNGELDITSYIGPEAFDAALV
ncbi:aromatic prenyltransferase [Aspergillus lucknowensis]|uniref:Aromatic prenyltransferase n=1 Tax=Aspergillus lucknowensis TaxID=176173 RepID=A0ABR4LCD2_9EURO